MINIIEEWLNFEIENREKWEGIPGHTLRHGELLKDILGNEVGKK